MATCASTRASSAAVAGSAAPARRTAASWARASSQRGGHGRGPGQDQAHGDGGGRVAAVGGGHGPRGHPGRLGWLPGLKQHLRELARDRDPEIRRGFRAPGSRGCGARGAAGGGARAAGLPAIRSCLPQEQLRGRRNRRRRTPGGRRSAVLPPPARAGRRPRGAARAASRDCRPRRRRPRCASEGVGGGQRETAPVRRGQAGQDDLAGQRVAEREAVTVVHHQLRGQRHGAARRRPRPRGRPRPGRAAASRSGGRAGPRPRGPAARGPRRRVSRDSHGVREPRRKAAQVAGGQQVLDQERKPLGGAHHRRGHALAAAVPAALGRCRRATMARTSSPVRRPIGQTCAPAAPSTGRDILPAVARADGGQHGGRHLVRVVGQVPGYGQRRVVSPVQVLQDHYHACALGGPAQHPQYGLGRDQDRLCRGRPAQAPATAAPPTPAPPGREPDPRREGAGRSRVTAMMTSATGPSGPLIPAGKARPVTTAEPALAATALMCPASLLLPIPASPVTTSAPPRPRPPAG